MLSAVMTRKPKREPKKGLITQGKICWAAVSAAQFLLNIRVWRQLFSPCYSIRRTSEIIIPNSRVSDPVPRRAGLKLALSLSLKR